MSTKLKCLLLDDELPGLTYLKMLCEQLPELEVVKSFNNPAVFLEEISNLDFDLCILDIEMPEMNGLQVANLLNGKPVIFTTAYKEYAAEAFDLNAIDYVRKPVQKERLQQAIHKAQLALTHKPAEKLFFQANSDKGKSIIFFDQLLYITVSEIDSRDKTVTLSNNHVLTLKNISFEKLLEILPANDFVRVNKREVIALKVVQAFSADEVSTSVKMLNGSSLKVILSEAYRAGFVARVTL